MVRLVYFHWDNPRELIEDEITGETFHSLKELKNLTNDLGLDIINILTIDEVCKDHNDGIFHEYNEYMTYINLID